MFKEPNLIDYELGLLKKPLLLYASPSSPLYSALFAQFNMRFAETFDEAVRLLVGLGTETALVDLGMAGGDGLTFIAHAAKASPLTSIIVMGADDNARRRLESEKVKNYFPVSASTEVELFSKITRICAEAAKPGRDMRLGEESFLKYNRLLDVKTSIFAERNHSKAILFLGRELARAIPKSALTYLEMEAAPVFHFVSSHARTESCVDEPKKFSAEIWNIINKRAPMDVSSIRTKASYDDTSEPATPGEKATILAIIPLYHNETLQGLFSVVSFNGISKEDDYLLKHFARRLQETFYLLNNLRGQLSRDYLTRLYNRGFFETALEKACAESRQNRKAATVAMIDIDHFKNLNDSYGHQVGDSLLCELGRMISECAKPNDIVSRHGGDEFAVLMYESSEKEARAFADRMLQEARTHVFKDSGFPLRVTISIGWTVLAEDSQENEATIMEKVDKALYSAKKGGRNQACGEREHRAAQTKAEKPAPSQHVEGEPEAATILILDDEPAILALLKHMLETLGHNVKTTTSPFEALDIVRAQPDGIDVIFSDITMPEMNGIDFLRAALNIDPNIVNMIITGFPSSENVIAALRAGAFNIIPKPFNRDELALSTERAVEKRRMRRRLDYYYSSLESLLYEKTSALQASLASLKESYLHTMEAIVNILDTHETATADHSRRVSDLAVFLARRMGVSNSGELETIKYGAILHDIGKIGVPNVLINKPAKLTDEERDLMQKHVELGYNVLKNIPALKDAADIVRSHHERFDGKGYPRGLTGKDICLGARIFSLVDTFDALRSGRVYSRAVPLEKIVMEINKCSGTQFDPDVVKAFNECYVEFDRAYLRSVKASDEEE